MSRGPDVLVIRSDRWKAFRVLLLTPIMLGASAILAFLHPAPFAKAFGWIGLIFFVVCTLAWILRVVRPDRLTLTAEGFTLRDWKQTQRIRWVEVKKFVLWSSSGTKMASWILHDDARQASLMARINSNFGVDGSIGISWPEPPHKMRDLLSRWKNRYAPEPRPHQG